LGWILTLLLGTDLFIHLFLVTSFSMSVLRNGDIFEISGIEGYGLTRYLPYAEVKTPYTSGDYSVVVLGNSYTMAKQVMDWQNYVSVAETLLNKNGIHADLHNLGINGLALPSYIVRSRFVIDQYKPDVVVVQVSPDEFLNLGFKETLAGGHFGFDAADKLTILPPRGADTLLPEQIAPNLNDMNLWDYSALYAYRAYIDRQNGKRDWNVRQVDLQGNSTANLAAQELELLQNAYGDIPIVFVLVPQDISIGRNEVRYQDSDNYKLIINFIGNRHPNWKVIYPAIEFNQLLQTGFAPKGFGNSQPFVGHMNIYGHQVLGEILAQTLSGLLK